MRCTIVTLVHIVAVARSRTPRRPAVHECRAAIREWLPAAGRVSSMDDLHGTEQQHESQGTSQHSGGRCCDVDTIITSETASIVKRRSGHLRPLVRAQHCPGNRRRMTEQSSSLRSSNCFEMLLQRHSDGNDGGIEVARGSAKDVKNVPPFDATNEWCSALSFSRRRHGQPNSLVGALDGNSKIVCIRAAY